MTDIATLIKRLPVNELAFGGSHGGKVYQDYPWPPLDRLPAKRATTQARLDFINDICNQPTWKGRRVLDIGCANGAISIGLALQGATVTAWDWNKSDLDIGKRAAKELGVDVTFQERDITAGIAKGSWDFCLYLSVWKWIAWRTGIEAACQTLTAISDHCSVLIFESGLTGTGIDLVKVGMDEVGPMLRRHTRYSRIFMGGHFPRDHQQVDRPVWMCL